MGVSEDAAVGGRGKNECAAHAPAAARAVEAGARKGVACGPKACTQGHVSHGGNTRRRERRCRAQSCTSSSRPCTFVWVGTRFPMPSEAMGPSDELDAPRRGLQARGAGAERAAARA